ncbi:MAG TPA: CHRD domain-containing protein [Caulobacteraceae bacterium]
MRTVAAFAVVSALFAATPAMAQVVNFTAKLNGAAETPPNDSKGTGEAHVTLDTVNRKVSWTVTYAGLTGPATAAHFHGPAAEGSAAPVAVPLTSPLASPVKGSATISDVQVGNLRAGMWYVNVHTAAHPAGEIRGQLSEIH